MKAEVDVLIAQVPLVNALVLCNPCEYSTDTEWIDKQRSLSRMQDISCVVERATISPPSSERSLSSLFVPFVVDSIVQMSTTWE